MLKPAILYKGEIERKFKEYYYTDDMMFYIGYNESSFPNIPDVSSDGRFYWAITEDENKIEKGKKPKLLGYVAYQINLDSMSADKFGAFSFDRGNYIVGRELRNIITKLLSTMHRVEFRAISGNPAIKGYDRLLNRYKYMGRKLILKDVFKDINGNYRDDYIYEFINEEVK